MAIRRGRFDWIDVETAVELTGRSEVTLRRWRRQRLVTAGKLAGQRLYDRRSLLIAMRIADQRQKNTRFDGTTPGPGCKGKPVETEGQMAIDLDWSAKSLSKSPGRISDKNLVHATV